MGATRQPLHIEIDLELGYPLVYVRYVQPHEAFRPRSKRVSNTLIIDTNANGDLVGIELLDADAETISAARNAAATHDAVFPSCLNADLGQPASRRAPQAPR